MQNYNKPQQAIILKGVAQQILSMGLPDFHELGKMLNVFGFTVIDNERLNELVVSETKQETGHLESSNARIELQILAQDWIKTVDSDYTPIARWMQEQYDEWLDIHNLECLTVIE